MNLTELIAGHRKGNCAIEAQQKLQELVRSCQNLGKKGRFTLSFEITPAEKGTVLILDEIAIKVPKPTRQSNTYFTTDEGALSKTNPNQKEFDTVVSMAEAQ